MSLAALSQAIASTPNPVVSTDLFDTVLLRDHTTETQRLAKAARRAGVLLGVDPDVVVKLRWTCHDSAYRAVAMERPGGEATLQAICRTMASAMGLDDRAAAVLLDTEVSVDIEHLRANRRLTAVLRRARTAGARVVAVSDTYYSGRELRRILNAVVGDAPIDAVYSSADLGRTKHAGGIFDLVAEAEAVPVSRILHVGDDHPADVVRARAASWVPIHLPRGGAYRAVATTGRVLGMPSRLRRLR
ncbi:HAD family hydrolase [Blastococcus saxobsidens]|uniref:HAD family hydrolase n=1 Tax=Blastococcus saxobsidens TaxID=138336 RepID=A0A4V2G2Q5_9ACTN|nr:HAD family hydrolase [Blastococcus saxobsidens]RZU34086.1 hypothetical protein BKA19_3840 [Blastococcus saxobsidens]